MADLFDALASEAEKEIGMAAAAESRRRLLEFARGIAVKVAMSRADRCVTADDVQAALVQHGVGVRSLGNAAGSLFVGKCWQWTGEFVKSARVHAHRNLLRRWKYVGGSES